MRPIQKIYFGSPGTGKSYKIDNDILLNLNINKESENVIKTVFHPEYTYGDFMGKLLPITKGEGEKRRVEYNYYAGHFLKALAQAYRNILIAYLQPNENQDNNEGEEENRDLDSIKNVALIIDELNRGNSAAIFGTVFQLLDREKNINSSNFGWSSYVVDISEMEFQKLLELIGLKYKEDKSPKSSNKVEMEWGYEFDGFRYRNNKHPKKELETWLSVLKIRHNQIRIPSNLHLVATMNTSDNSIYFMDNAFKRRWDWEFVNVEEFEIGQQPQIIQEKRFQVYDKFGLVWAKFVHKLNKFIRSNYKNIRKIEDKQIGYFFINEETITENEIKNKLMFFIWDSVFSNNKKPLVELLWGKESVKEKEKYLVTFGHFTKRENVTLFVDKIMNFEFEE